MARTTLKKIKNFVSGVKETYNNYSGAAKATKAAKQNAKTNSIKVAQKKYKERTGKEMTPSMLKSEMEGGILSKNTKQYLKDKKEALNKSKKKFML